MNRKIIALSGLVAVMGFAGASANAADANASAGAKIVAPIQITKTADLYFGTIVPSTTSADTVAINAAGAKTCGSALTCITTDHTAAAFNVTGQADESYTITLPTTITISSGSDTMTVNNFAGSQSSGTLSSGTDSFTVGGTLNVAASQNAGDYTGTFQVTVEYQ